MTNESRHGPPGPSPEPEAPLGRGSRCGLQRCSPLLAALALWLLAPRRASANERHFAYTYESATVPVGQVELEPWVTLRTGRDGYGRRMDHRVELEWGIARNVQTALYLNWSASATPEGERIDWQGVSNEWKWQLADPSADPVGFALYFEPGIGPAEADLELKVLADKRIGNVLLAANLIGEVEWEWTAGTAADGTPEREAETEYVLEATAAGSYLLTESVSAGLEARSHNRFAAGGLQRAALFAGPVASWRGPGIWATGAVLLQLPALVAEGNRTRERQGHEAVEARVVLGVQL